MIHYHNKEYNILQDNKGNKIAQLKTNPSDTYLIWNIDRVEFNELEGNISEQGVVRIFSTTEEGCKIQFRATQPLKRGQKERHLIATAHFSKEDLQYILNQLK